MSSDFHSNSVSVSVDDEVYEDEFEDVETAREERECPRCHGTGSVLLHGQDTDCLDCEGYGSILID